MWSGRHEVSPELTLRPSLSGVQQGQLLQHRGVSPELTLRPSLSGCRPRLPVRFTPVSPELTLRPSLSVLKLTPDSLA